MTKKNALVIGILGKQFRMEMMVPQRAKELTKTSEGLPVSLTVSIQRKQENMKYRYIISSRVELKKAVIHPSQIPGQQ